MKQHGTAWLPIIFWVAVIFLAGTAAVRSGVISVDKPNPQADKQANVNLPSATFSSPTPIPTIAPQRQTNQQVQNTSTITHDGSRTGPIVKYHSLCSNSDISVYENELIPYKRITGETIYTTTGDIKCYEDQINQLKQTYQNNTSASGNCEAGPGNWVHASSLQECQNLQAQYYSTHSGSSYQDNRINCPVDNNCNGNPQTYLLYPDTCTTVQKSAQQNCQQQAQLNQQTQKQQQNLSAYQDCTNAAGSNYQGDLQSIGGQCTRLILDPTQVQTNANTCSQEYTDAQNKYNNAIQQCKTQYGY